MCIQSVQGVNEAPNQCKECEGHRKIECYKCPRHGSTPSKSRMPRSHDTLGEDKVEQVEEEDASCCEDSSCDEKADARDVLGLGYA